MNPQQPIADDIRLAKALRESTNFLIKIGAESRYNGDHVMADAMAKQVQVNLKLLEGVR